ncbi:hypothetical protein BJF79_21460 [Actinomadura sp. CNU-125]|uniref:DUF4190 domain-containing protein n=1 Tax=Actinomadura sp. CNU-125 TaxID=1904961 RepID=UPI00095B16E9|nr:DUF4190 domain-containing protein [Actinomadura sp. CNU-125]OLT12782.1 hypothetical protein BJF79_21460 [Actinomadura sp. CNU-125]
MALPGYQTYTPPAPRPHSRLARGSLVLGIVGLLGLAVCLLGVVPAIVGLVLGSVSLARHEADRWPAVVGVILSAAALVTGGLALYFLLSKAAECGDETRYPSSNDRRYCVEREFPFARSTITP